MFRFTWTLISLCIFLWVENASSANILALFPLATKSHNNVFSTITFALANRGHSFTVITSQPIKSSLLNYRQINVYPLVGHRLDIFNVTTKLGFLDLLGEIDGMTAGVCKDVMQKEEVKSLVKPDAGTKFDLILITNFFAECFYGFAHVYNAPMVILSPGGPMSSTYSAVGNVILPSFYAETGLGYGDRMTFKERTINALAQIPFALFYKYYIQANVEKEMRVAFGEDIPSIAELEEHVSLAVLNNHFSLNEPRQTVPCLIEAGGLHLKTPKELPDGLKEFMDGAGEDGVIYFSLGSVLKSANFPEETREELMAAFTKVKQRVLWKWEGDNPLPGQPKNVRLEKWLPQQDVLAHPHTKMFITHGGLLSFQEAANWGVPIVGIPYYGDQDMNINRVLKLQVGVKVDSQNITSANILNAINEVLENPIYSKNMKKIRSRMIDQRDDPLSRAIYWIEYVLRHDGAQHLKPAAFYLSWYQIYMLDIIFLVIVLPSIVLMAICLFVLKLFRKRCKCKGKEVASTKKNE